MRAVYSRTVRGVRALATARRHSARTAKHSADSGRNDRPVRRAPPAPHGPVDTMTLPCRGRASGTRTRPEDILGQASQPTKVTPPPADVSETSTRTLGNATYR